MAKTVRFYANEGTVNVDVPAGYHSQKKVTFALGNLPPTAKVIKVVAVTGVAGRAGNSGNYYTGQYTYFLKYNSNDKYGNFSGDVALSWINANGFRTMAAYVGASSSEGAKISFTPYLDITYEGGSEYLDETVQYGTANGWQECYCFYAQNGQWVQCEVYYGRNGKWVKTNHK